MICERYAHCRRKFCEAKDIEPERAEAALEMIGALYAIEEKIRQQQLAGAAKRAVRQAESRPIVDRFFNWVDQQFERQGLLPSSPQTTALAYAGERREGLRVYLDDPDVAIDTNHLERALRPIPLGKRTGCLPGPNSAPSRSVSCKASSSHAACTAINPYHYLVDVLQRVGQHPASRVNELTPRMWKQLFADNPLRSPLHYPAT